MCTNGTIIRKNLNVPVSEEESFSALGYSFDLQSIGDTVERTGLNQVNWDPQLPDLLGLESSS